MKQTGIEPVLPSDNSAKVAQWSATRSEATLETLKQALDQALAILQAK